MKRYLIPLLCLALAAVTRSAAADATPPRAPAPSPTPSPSPENGRFSMAPVADGFLRLDTRNGGVSFCRVAGGVAQCRSSADERAALEAEIARLAEENARLRAAAPATAAAAPATPGVLSNLPKDADVDRALNLMGKVMRGMAKIIKEAESEQN